LRHVRRVGDNLAQARRGASMCIVTQPDAVLAVAGA
jgi:hypothetical protein